MTVSHCRSHNDPQTSPNRRNEVVNCDTKKFETELVMVILHTWVLDALGVTFICLQTTLIRLVCLDMCTEMTYGSRDNSRINDYVVNKGQSTVYSSTSKTDHVKFDHTKMLWLFTITKLLGYRSLVEAPAPVHPQERQFCDLDINSNNIILANALIIAE